MHGPGLGAGPGLPAWLQLLGRRRGRRRPGAPRRSGFRLGGRGCGLSPTAEPGAPGPGPGQQPWQQWQHQQQPWPPPLPCQASPARAPRGEWAWRGRGPAGERCLRRSGRVRFGRLSWARALPQAASHFRGPGASGRSVPSAGSLLFPRMGNDTGSPSWSESVLPPAAAEAGGRRGGQGRGGREGGRRGRRWRGARVCAPRLGCGSRPRPIPPDDAPAAGSGERSWPGSTVLLTLGLGLHGGGREGAPGRGVGRREPSLRQPQAQRRWDPVIRAPPPRLGLALGHAPSLGPASLLPATALKVLLFPLEYSPPACFPHPFLVPHSQVLGFNPSNLPLCPTSGLPPSTCPSFSLFQKPFHMFQFP